MEDATQRDREDTFRADVARLVQAMHHHLPTSDVPPEVADLREPVQRLASLLEADAPAEHLQEAALAVVDSYDWPSPEASGGGEGRPSTGRSSPRWNGSATPSTRWTSWTRAMTKPDQMPGDRTHRAGPGRGYDE